MNQQTSVFAPVKERTKDFYFFHIVGSPTSYKYIVETQMLQTIIMGIPVVQSRVPMTYEEFERNIISLKQAILKKLVGVN